MMKIFGEKSHHGCGRVGERVGKVKIAKELAEAVKGYGLVIEWYRKSSN